MSLLKGYTEVLKESRVGELLLTDTQGFLPVSRKKLIKALYHEIVYNRDMILAFKGCIISDLLDIYTDKQLNRIKFMEALNLALDCYLMSPYELPEPEEFPVLPGNMLSPFVHLVKSYNKNSVKFRKVYNTDTILDLNSFRRFCKLLNGVFKTEFELKTWANNNEEIAGNDYIIFVLLSGMNFEADELTSTIRPCSGKMNCF